MCAALSVPRSGYYKWLGSTSQSNDKQREDAMLKMKIRQIHKDSRETYGRPRLHVQLQRDGHQCGKHRLVRLMREEGIRGLQKKRYRVKTTDSNPMPMPSRPICLMVILGPVGRTRSGWRISRM